ncbi:hypothetical protein BOTBODRAFT_121958, partial [Botryobasidium botryosum FD-172 SS1]
GPFILLRCHRDYKNLAYGLCMLIVLGAFDYEKGGQLVLHELKLVIDLKPGDVLFLPSALITHQNLPIGEDETRFSITGYTAGGLFQLYDHFFLSQVEIRREIAREKEDMERGEGTEGYLEHLELLLSTPEGGQATWNNGWELFLL